MPLIWDAHSCLPLHPETKVSALHRHRNAGVSFVSVNVGMDMNPLQQIMPVIASFRRQIANDPNLIQVQDIQDITRAHQQEKLAVAFDLEGAIPLLECPDMISLYWQLGVRQIHLAYNRNNSVAGGCHDDEQGLTKLGHKILQRINTVGMLIDVSHTSYRSSMDIFNASSSPVIYSHANPQSVTFHRRNITDEQIRACAATGGVICINGVERFLGSNTVDQFIKHLLYVVDLVGPQHVGIGLDTFTKQTGIDDNPANLEPTYWWPKSDYSVGIGELSYLQPEDFEAIQFSLAGSGLSTDEQEAILGQNMLRIATKVWPN